MTTGTRTTARPRSAAGSTDLRRWSESGLDEIQWRVGKAIRHAPVDRRVPERSLVDSDPIRIGPQWQNRPNQHGLYFWSPTGEHVWYESALEAANLLVLEFEQQVVKIASQPFRILFKHDASSAFHDPDFFAVHGDGDQVVYDIKPRHRIDREAKAQFDETARVCELAGWRHIVLSEPDPWLLVNLRFLRNARHRRAHPDPELFEQLIGVFADGRSIAEGRAMVARRHPALAMPYIRHLLWKGVLRTDLAAPLGAASIVTTSPLLEASCCA